MSESPAHCGQYHLEEGRSGQYKTSEPGSKLVGSILLLFLLQALGFSSCTGIPPWWTVTSRSHKPFLWPWCLSQWQSSTAHACAWHPSGLLWSTPLLLKGQTLSSGLLFFCLPGFYILWGQDKNFDLIWLTGSWISKLAVPTSSMAYSAIDPVVWAPGWDFSGLTSKHFPIGFTLLSHHSSIYPLTWRRQRAWHHVLYFCWKIFNIHSEIINGGKLGR